MQRFDPNSLPNRYMKWILKYLNNNSTGLVLELHNHPCSLDADLVCKVVQSLIFRKIGLISEDKLMKDIFSPAASLDDRAFADAYWQTAKRYRPYVWGNGIYRLVSLPSIMQ